MDLLKRRAPLVMAVILLYHRVANVPTDPHALSVTPAEFREHVRYLVDSYRLVSLESMLSTLATDSLPPESVAVTFDDGMIDNLQYAAPLLAQHGVPATYFIMTDRLDERHEPWWETLARVFLTGAPLPPSLTLDLTDARETRRLATDTRAAQSEAYFTIHGALMHASLARRIRTLAHIETWSELDLTPREENRVMLAPEIRELSSMPGQTIGAHTVHHLMLPEQTEAEQDREIQDSKAMVERVLGRPVTLFSYPFGRRSACTIEAVRRAGFDGAVSTQPAAVRPDTAPFDLPRLDVKPHGVAGLARLIADATFQDGSR